MKTGLFLIILLIVLTSLFDTISQLFLKTSINSIKISVNNIKKLLLFIFRLLRIPWIYLSCIFSCLSLFIWLYVLSKAELNFAFSVDSMHYIFIALASKFFLKEKVGTTRWIGTIFVLIGIILVSLSR